MVKQTQTLPFPGEAAAWLGDLHPLVEQLGSVEGLSELAAIANALRLRPIDRPESLRAFLLGYHEQLLAPVELPAIHEAFRHAERNEVRELVAQDRQLAGEPVLREFQSASRRVGQAQLHRFRPLRDCRLVQRYLQSVDAGEANGWHTLVYGLTLAVYSLPLRQGLIDYAHQVTWGFIHAAARPLALTEQKARTIYENVSTRLVDSVESLFTDFQLAQPAGE